MYRIKLYSVFIAAMLVMFAFWLPLASTNEIEARANVTPTLIVTARDYFPAIFGVMPLYTPTATKPPPTMTPWASLTPTDTAEPGLTPWYTPTNTATPSLTPSPTASGTPGPSPTATNTPTATATTGFQLPKPILYAIDNGDGDGNYGLAWSAVPGATRYFMKENYNNTSWVTIYDGPALGTKRTNMAVGSYCYNVRAYGPAGRSDWAGEQCTTVSKQPFVCEFQTLANGPRTFNSGLALLHDGRLFITGGRTELLEASPNAYIFDPATRQFKDVPLPQGGGSAAAVLSDGRVMLTVYGNDPHTMIYDPVSEEVKRLDTFVGCLEITRNLADGFLLTYCGSIDGGIYDPGSNYARTSYKVEVNYRNYAPDSFAVPNGVNTTLLTNGVLGDVVTFDNPDVSITPAFDHRNDFWPNTEVSMAASADLNTLYLSGGTTYDEWGLPMSSSEAFAVNLSSYDHRPIADLLAPLWSHTSLGLADGQLMVLGGYSSGKNTTCRREVDIYDPDQDRWFEAGMLNSGRCEAKAIQLPNNEIFVYSGQLVPGGYNALTPPEIGHCSASD